MDGWMDGWMELELDWPEKVLVRCFGGSVFGIFCCFRHVESRFCSGSVLFVAGMLHSSNFILDK